MDFRPLGRTGVQVSKLCLGTMAFGGEADASNAADMYSASRDLGINFFDCANTYVKGRAEEVLGGLIEPHRDEVVITSKCFNAIGKDINARGASRRYIVRAVEESLRRLRTDRIDVLFMHQWDERTPIEETLRALEDLVRSGKVLYLGASNYSAWQVAKSLGISERHAWTRFEVIQPMYNLAKRQAEAEILPMAASEQLGVITYSPLGGGLLSGKYGRTARPNSGRLVDNERYAKRYSQDAAYEAAQAFTEFAAAHGAHPVSLAIAWVMSHAAVTAPIIGGRSLQQLQPALDALRVEMPDALRARIGDLSPEPAPATDRLEERG